MNGMLSLIIWVMAPVYNHDLAFLGGMMNDNNNFICTTNIKWLWQLQFLIDITCNTDISFMVVGLYIHGWAIASTGFTGVLCHLIDRSCIQWWILIKYFSILYSWSLCMVIKIIWYDHNKNPYPYSKVFLLIYLFTCNFLIDCFQLLYYVYLCIITVQEHTWYFHTDKKCKNIFRIVERTSNLTRDIMWC